MHQPTIRLDDLRSVLRSLLHDLEQFPEDWDPAATTYDIPRFHGGEAFLERFEAAARQILAGGDARAALTACGLPYDYARLGTPFSSVYELYVQLLTGAEHVVSFASHTKAFLAPLEVPGRTTPVRIFCRGQLPISDATRTAWQRRQVTFHEGFTGPLPADDPATLTLFVADTAPEHTSLAELPADAVCCPVPDGGVLLVRRGDRLDPKALQLIRKRTVAALLAVTARAELARLVGVELPPAPVATEEESEAALLGCFPGATGAACFCTGLAAEAAVFEATAELAGAGAPVRLFYAENGYGGTGQLIYDILSADDAVTACPLPVMGEHTLVDRVLAELERTPEGAAMVFVETPTNPQLQLHDFPWLMEGLRRHHAQTGQQVPVLVDTTMAPLYPLFELDFAQDWPFLLVKSGSKYMTRGKATLGLVLAGDHPLAQGILEATRERGRQADSFAKGPQRKALVDGVTDLVPRMKAISAHTTDLAARIRHELAVRGHDDITLYTMTPEQLDAGLHSGVLSFYLPAAPTTYPDLCDAFVDWLLEQATPGLVKNRVSYGQSTGGGKRDPFYVINPEESTQGALSAEVKEAQKQGGVQICRISVPEHADLDGLVEAMQGFFDRTYGTPRGR